MIHRWALSPVLIRSVAWGLPLAGVVEWAAAAFVGRPAAVEAFWRFSFAWSADEALLLRHGGLADVSPAALVLVAAGSVLFGFVLAWWSSAAALHETHVDRGVVDSRTRFALACWRAELLCSVGHLAGVLYLGMRSAAHVPVVLVPALTGLCAGLRLAAWGALIGDGLVQRWPITRWLSARTRPDSRRRGRWWLWEVGASLVALLLWWAASAGHLPLVLVGTVVGGVAVPIGLGFRPALEPAMRDVGVIEPPPPPPPIVGPLVRIPAGRFRLGSPAGEPGRFGDEGPIEGVEVGAFEIAKTQVTRRVWRGLMPKDRWPGAWGGDQDDSELPANHVSWYDTLDFCNAASRAEGRSECYVIERSGTDVTEVRWDRDANGYRLPTEAEWEYAARAGEAGAYPWGDDGSDEAISAHAWWYKNARGPRPVGTKPSNRWELHDMIGNVWEWCWDAFEDQHDPNGRDGTVGSGRVVRGGSFIDGFDFAPRNLRSAFRHGNEPSVRLSIVGFRVVRVPFRQHGSTLAP